MDGDILLLESYDSIHFLYKVYVVTNADKFKHFERWATASDFPIKNLVNDGTTSYDMRLGK